MAAWWWCRTTSTSSARCVAERPSRDNLTPVTKADQSVVCLSGYVCVGGAQVCSDIYVCGDGQVKRFPGSFQDYRNSFLSKLRKANATSSGR